MNAPRRILKLTIAYDGTAYVGWQRQPSGPSIQGCLEEALRPFEGQPVTVHGAGRTDAGVHALAQVASVALTTAHPAATLQRALNAVLPADIRVLAVEDAPADFHARFSATGKIYEYRIVNAPYASPFLCRYAWHVAPRLDVAAMIEASRALVGRHDFSAFQAADSDVSHACRTIEHLTWTAAEGPDRVLVMRVEGDGFLRHMVRNIAGTLVEVGLGRWPPARISGILASRDRTEAGKAAPALGLFLVGVRY
jgi:tRNA pseudouridine38-40 synthase